MSAISISPALSVWIESPDSGTSTTRLVSAVRAMSSSALADADGLDENSINAERVEHVGDFARRGGEPAERAARGHRPNEHAGVERDRLHADPVAEQRAAGERRRRIDRDDADREPRLAVRARRARW